MTMTMEAMKTLVRRQQAELIAVDLLLDALMRALPQEQQDAWLQQIRSLAATRQAALRAHGADPTAVRVGQHAIERRAWRLEDARSL